MQFRGRSAEETCAVSAGPPQVTSKQLGGLLGIEPGARVGQGPRCSAWRGDRRTHMGAVGSLWQHLLSTGQTRGSVHDAEDISVPRPLPRRPGDSEQESEAPGGQHLAQGHRGRCQPRPADSGHLAGGRHPQARPEKASQSSDLGHLSRSSRLDLSSPGDRRCEAF